MVGSLIKIMKIPRMGDILVEEKIITEDILHTCLNIQKDQYIKTGVWKVLGEVLLDEGYITPKDQILALNKKLQYQVKILSGENQVEKENELQALRTLEAVDSQLNEESVTAVMLRIQYFLSEIEKRKTSIDRLKKMVQKPFIVKSIENYEKDISKYQAAVKRLQEDLNKFSR